MGNEKILVTSVRYKVSRYIWTMTVLLILWYIFLFTLGGYSFKYVKNDMLHPAPYTPRIMGVDEEFFEFFIIPVILYLLLGVFPYLLFRKTELTVTEQRITGKRAFGRTVELPINQVSAIAMGGIKGVAVATSSGMIKFSFIKNRQEIFDTVSALLRERQEMIAHTDEPNAQNAPQSDADELAKFKQLLDSGAITQEEYDAKKKQLLRL